MTKELEKALRHIKTRADLWAVREVEKALSQEPILDKIKEVREEVANKYDDFANSWDERAEGKNEMINEVLEMLDKLIER